MNALFFISFLSQAAWTVQNGSTGLTIHYRSGTDHQARPALTVREIIANPDYAPLSYRIGIPQDGSAAYRILQIEEERYPGQQLPNFLDLSIEEPAGAVARMPAALAKVSAWPVEPVQISDPSWFRDYYTVELRINPVRRDPATGELVLIRQLKLSVIFHGQSAVRPGRPDPFARIYEKTIVNYNQCKDWRRLIQRDDHNPFSSSPHWYKISVAEEGLYRIREQELRAAGLDPRQFDPRTMKIYTAGFELLPSNVHSLFPDSLIEIPVLVQGEEDGVFDADDYLVFYGFPASHYYWDSSSHWFENGYARERTYWFTFGGNYGRRMVHRLCAWNGDTPDTLVTECRHYEEDVYNPTRSGINWFWQDISPQSGPSGSARFTISHPYAYGRARIKIGLYTVTTPVDTFHYRVLLNTKIFIDQYQTLQNQDTYPPHLLAGDGLIQGDSSLFEVDINRPATTTASLIAYLNHINLEYDRITDLTKPFHGYFPKPSVYSIRCRNVKSQPLVLDITDPLSPVCLDSLHYHNKTITFSHQSDSFQVLYFSGVSLAHFASLVPRSPGRLRQTDVGAEYVIITHSKFANALLPLVNYRRREYSVKVVTVDDIFDDYSFGKYDPLAIKHFLHATQDNWDQPPVYVFLIGDATYDYKNNLKKNDPPNFVPMYESGTTLSGNPGIPPNYIYDGEYVNFHNAGEEMILGRVTVRTNAELRAYFDKLNAYENEDLDGAWSKRLLLAADDEWADNYQWSGELQHTWSCEAIAFTLQDTLYDFTKLYMISYPPFVYPCKKTNAQEAFIRELNQGWFCGTFYGHGNTHQLAHEGVFYDTRIPLIRNGRRNGFFYFASCTVGRFDDSDYECIGEEFVRNPEIAIGALAATSGTDGFSNQTIGRRLFQYLTQNDTIYTMGEAAYLARNSYFGLHYVLFGDPATRMRRVTERVAITPAMDSVRPLETARACVAYQPYYLNAWVRDTTFIQKFDSLTANSISGRVRRPVQTGPTSWDTVEYKIYGREMYRGFWQAETASFIVPRILTGNRPVIRLSAYKSGRSGRVDSLLIYGTAAPSSDHTGPEVVLYEGGRRLKDGDWVNQEFVLTGRLSDPGGINFMNSKDDSRGFYLYLAQDLAAKIDLRDYFMYDRNSFISGEFNVRLVMPRPQDTVVVSVSDNIFNRTITRVMLNAELYNQVAIDHFLVYPNPVKDERGVWFTYNLTASGTVTIRVFTIAGRLLKTIADQPGYAGYNQIFWDGRDEHQLRLANGVYLVKAVVENESGSDNITEKFIIAR